MKLILWRILLSLGMSATGLALGAGIGARFFVTKADGMASGAMVLGYGVLGAVILLLISIFLGLKLKEKALPTTALIFALLAVVYYGALVFKAKEKFQNEAGSNSAYAMAGKFTASMARLDLSDPFLFVKIEVDSRKRKWVKTGPAPKNQVFTASIRAKTLIEMRAALEDLAAIPAEALADCNSNQSPATKRLRWDLIDAEIPPNGPGLVTKGVVNINDACVREHPVISRALMLVERASLSPMGDIKRK